MQKIIEVSGLNFGYDENNILHDLNFDVYEGEFLCFAGRNGVGKSTLIKILAGLITQNSGQVTIHTDHISYISQKLAFNNSFPATVYEIIKLGLIKDLKKLSKTDINRKIDDILEEVGIKNYKNRKIGELSGGQQQRVLIAKALVSSPKLILLDEATSGVDEKTTLEFCCLLSDLTKNKNISIIMVTHDINSILQHSNSVLYFSKKDIKKIDAEEYKKFILG